MNPAEANIILLRIKKNLEKASKLYDEMMKKRRVKTDSLNTDEYVITVDQKVRLNSVLDSINSLSSIEDISTKQNCNKDKHVDEEVKRASLALHNPLSKKSQDYIRNLVLL